MHTGKGCGGLEQVTWAPQSLILTCRMKSWVKDFKVTAGFRILPGSGGPGLMEWRRCE